MNPSRLDDPLPVAPRTSTLAISSLVFGLLCCIPGFGLVSSILGGAGLVRISASDGRLVGRGMALTGLILGLLGTFGWIGLGVGLSQAMNQVGGMAQSIVAFQAADPSAARAALTAAASASVTDEQLQAFRTALNNELGAFKSTPKGLAGWLSDYSKVGTFRNSPLASGRPADFIPLPAHFDKGLALIALHLDPAVPPPQFANISVHLADGRAIWLIPSDRTAPLNPGTPAPPKAESPKTEPPKTEPPKTEPPKTEPAPPAGETPPPKP